MTHFRVSNPRFAKFGEAVQILSNKGLITFDASQSNRQDFQVPTSKGLAQDTSAPVIGITSAETFLQRIESESGSLDAVAKDYLRESYQAADEDLWLSSTFMLGAASERLIYVLADHVETIIADPNASAELQSITKVRQRKEWIVKQLPATGYRCRNAAWSPCRKSAHSLTRSGIDGVRLT